MKLALMFLVVALIALPAFATDWGVAPVEEKSEFGMGMFVPNAEVTAKVQETVCVDGVCYQVHPPASNSEIFEPGVDVPMDAPIEAFEVRKPVRQVFRSFIRNRERPLFWRFRPFLRARMGW